MTGEIAVARRMWWLLEPIHAVLYYAPAAFEHAGGLGYAVRERWPSYFAWRAAPLGAVDAETVAEAFYSFSPRMVAEHVPAAWQIAAPQQVLSARLAAIEDFYRSMPGVAALAEAAGLARRAAESARTRGRALAAANAAQPWPDEPVLVLWQAATILREHRGDGHLTALREHGLDPVESLVSFASVQAAPPEVFASRGWSEQQWAAARERLLTRGLLEESGRATGRGREVRDAVERRTDELAAEPWRALGEGTGALAQLARPALEWAVGSGVLPVRSTLGIGMRFSAA
ncbi:hypothetical protein SAMN02982929_01166 [Saccharopolyspora kobensis]|uniref:SalK n=3 Tax=Saccharopolyspora kobensis TaxID=146035 RepID=A0A1H5WFZ0_9PSEU|nr:hypothetical protein [Saccharopolyspora kobensis]SEF98121.1 hypothetical protein SAMN02982929_01166 [Saccharopolyspora kobensis]SFD75200.1 hypothetical protein SAMN05216506_106139 [Saccharopolyspora kobensis]